MTAPEEDADRWVAAVAVDVLAKRRKLKIDTDVGEIVLLWHEGRACALANICIHRERELVNGTIFNGRIVCPGHQWAFDLETGYCKEREETQPVHPTRIEDDMVLINLSASNIPDAQDR
ncbi:Rieske (2Fe-2S) protein [Candidatus Poriferisocius sp.]|uniref:Rieske (2Fe-2S) protein n=1 Tax=Candidatus Poriferisocius sp. TaxID=3101276 RepID=UPI003B5B83CA